MINNFRYLYKKNLIFLLKNAKNHLLIFGDRLFKNKYQYTPSLT